MSPDDGFPTDTRARPDLRRAHALLVALTRAERHLGLDGPDLTLVERAQRILLAALPGRLDPRLYALAWMVRETAHTRH